MEKNKIGTDASMPVHIENICQRGYVKVDENRKLIPTKLGKALIEALGEVDPGIIHPDNRAKIEDVDVYGKKEVGRGDVIVLADIDEDATDIVKATTKEALLKAFGKEAAKFSDNGIKGNGKFTAVFAPRVAYDFGYSEKDVYSNDQLFPASFHYLACAAYAQERYAEWYAVAGYTRGICGKPIKYLTKTFGDVDVNTLCPRVANDYAKVAAVNLIITERGNYYL